LAVEQWLHDMLTGDDTNKRGLYLQGDVGVGKTSLAISALEHALQSEQPGLFISTVELFKRIRACYRKDSPISEDDLLHAVTETPYVVIDDLGAEKPTDFVISELYYIVNHRLSSGHYTIITSNVTSQQLEAIWRPQSVKAGDFHNGKRVIERLKQHCLGITIGGRNERKK
jgi:DNA replication protein DnaC